MTLLNRNIKEAIYYESKKEINYIIGIIMLLTKNKKKTFKFVNWNKLYINIRWKPCLKKNKNVSLQLTKIS